MYTHKLLAVTAALGIAACAPTQTEAAPRPFNPTRFSVEVQGQGPDVILIPGLTAGRDVWRATANAVPGYRYHLVQVNGFAGSPVGGNAEGPVLAPIADELGRYIEARGLRRPAVVGHSMGGTLAMILGAQRPAQVGKVMVVDMLPQPAGLLGYTAENLGPFANAMRDLVATPGGARLFENFMGAFGPPQSQTNRSHPGLVSRAMHELATLDLGPQLSRMTVPLTVTYAVPNSQSRPQVVRTYANAYAPKRDAVLVPVENSGHMVMADQPQRFRAALRAFLGPQG